MLTIGRSMWLLNTATRLSSFLVKSSSERRYQRLEVTSGREVGERSGVGKEEHRRS